MDSDTNQAVSLSQSECEWQMGFYTGFSEWTSGFYSGSFADYGCFSKGANLYWGVGGTEEQMAIADLGGLKERVWC